MIEEINKMLKERASLEREYFELMHVSSETSLPMESFDRMMSANIAHSLAVIADVLANRAEK